MAKTEASSSGVGRITLDQLISEASTSVVRVAREHQLGNLKVPPKIWVGIWIDLEERLGGKGFGGQ